MNIISSKKFSVACFIAIAAFSIIDPTPTIAGALSPIGGVLRFDPRTAIDTPTDYEVYELVPGCTEFQIGDTFTKMEPSPPPYETTIGGSGLRAGTKLRLI